MRRIHLQQFLDKSYKTQYVKINYNHDHHRKNRLGVKDVNRKRKGKKDYLVIKIGK